MESKTYWTSLAEYLPEDARIAPRAHDEFGEDLPGELPVEDAFGADGQLSSSRRDFLKMLGFSVTAATLAASCETPVRKAIPYIVKPEEVTPGIATWYASTFVNGSDWCPILVKTREGRPIKIEGNRFSSLTQGGVDAKALASVLGLYNNKRLRQPMRREGERAALKPMTWEEADAAIGGKLQANSNLNIAILSQTVISPSTRAAVARFKASFPNTVHVAYDPVSEHEMLEANAAMYGRRAMPDVRLDQAKVIASFGADYLGTWGAHIRNVKGWAAMRKPTPEKPEMSQTFQFESWMSRSGANADYRVPLTDSKVAAALIRLHDLIAAKAGMAALGGAPALDSEKAEQKLAMAADALWANRGQSAVLCGLSDRGAHMIANSINEMLGNYGKTLSWERPCLLKQGNDEHLAQLMADMKAGKVDMLILYNCNPAYDVPGFAEALASVETSISTSGTADESARLCNFLLPDHHALESWSDAEPFAGMYNIVQPTIRPLFDTRQFQQTLLSWAGETATWYDFLLRNWETSVLSGELSAQAAWTKAVQHGVYEREANAGLAGDDAAFSASVSLADAASGLLAKIGQRKGDLELTVIESAVIGNGAYTDNPWLQETLDSITKVCWDNYAMVNPGWAREQGLSDGQHIKLSTPAGSISAPVLLQPGQARGAVAIAVGYGRTATGHPSTDNGVNAYRLLDASRATWSGASWIAESTKTTFARNQVYDSLFDDSDKKRPHVKETTLEEYRANPMAGNEDRATVLAHLKSFYPDRFANKNGFHWAMAIDLNSCIGCGACHVACQSENNVAVVGKQEMIRKHDMHWIRIDRYYAGTEDDPEVVFQPMMCQHCDNAPCENVCPVAATNHSSEGINQMAYNRCIGTRYCANNCPYKVRRFNWFDYLGADSFGAFNDKDPMAQDGEKGLLSELTRMVLNPDVTVRSRGVMEKCSFCVQRIQEAKLYAKVEGRPLADGDVKTACQTACSTGAISFGNLYDNNSEVYRLSEANDRAFRVLEEFHTLPSVTYLTKIRNKKPADHIHDVPFEGTLDQA